MKVVPLLGHGKLTGLEQGLLGVGVDYYSSIVRCGVGGVGGIRSVGGVGGGVSCVGCIG